MSTVFVPPEGSLEATIAFVGEGPGREELLKRRPFVGDTGREIDSLLLPLGIARSEIYLTNVEKTTLTKPDHARQIQCAVDLVREFERMPNLNVIVALGGIALETLTAWKHQGITHWRGSVLETFFGAKVIPTYHPAYYLHNHDFKLKAVIFSDLQRVLEQSKFPELRLPQRTFYIEPTYADAIEWLHHLEFADELAVDIETFGWGLGNTFVACIGFAPTPTSAYCIPIMTNGRAPYWTKEQELQIWRAISRVLFAPCKKFFQNGMFDIDILNEHFVKVTNFYHDTMLSHHLLYPELPHGLDFISSLYTLEPYYKEEGKTWSHRMDIRQLWTYNCKDVCVTLESGHALDDELREAKMFDYFHNYIMPLTWPLMEMKRAGIHVDKERLARFKEWLEAEVTFRQAELDVKAGFPVNVKGKNDMVRLLTENGIKITKTTPTGGPKLDEESIREYCRQAAANRGRDVTVGDEALDIREKRTLLSNFVDIETDNADMYHFSLLVHGTRTGRLASRAPRDADDNPLGPQMQNIPLPCRGVFSAADGKTLLSADLKQAEAMFVAFDAQDALMMEIFSSGQDIHKFNAANLFKKPQTQVNYLERWIAKRIVHGFDYGMGPRRVISVLAKDGFYISEAEARRCQKSYFQACPSVQTWQQRIGEQVRTTKTLTSPLGRRRVFLGLYDDKMMRDALAQNPQATIAEITNMGIIKLYARLPPHARVVLQVHDEVLVESDEDKWEAVGQLMVNCLTLPIQIHGRTLTIPVELKVGKFWADGMKEAHFDANERPEFESDPKVPSLHEEA